MEQTPELSLKTKSLSTPARTTFLHLHHDLKGWLLCSGLVMMLCFTEISSQDCSQLRSWLNKDNLKLLNSKMGSTIPLQCIGHVANFSNNEEIHSHEIQGEDAKAATQEILQQTLHIFRQNHSQMDWGETSIAGFQAGLHQDIEKLGRCLGAEKGNSIRQRVKSYFRRINDYLKDDGYSLCAWEIVQMEVRNDSPHIQEHVERGPLLFLVKASLLLELCPALQGFLLLVSRKHLFHPE
uniref:Uncharacterized protein n=1 Tax=Podarcis muralis TaxID=64176 RepID=A0A670K9P3_PODMU